MKNKYVDKFTKEIKGEPKNYDRKLNGIAGFLFLFIIFSVLIVFFSLTDIQNQILYLRIPELKIYAILMLSLYIPVETALNIAIIVFVFKRNIIFRKMFIIYSVIVVSAMLAAFIYFIAVHNYIYPAAIFRFVMTALWITYLYTSNRVKNTFIYPYTDFAQEEKNQLFEMKQSGGQ